ncbi:MATE family efflux transporter [Actinomyces bowdenii]|uniref:murein biosynthesis integral membrane protein MurJ n=1 Tax=Actinomyces bowdenii TaxID=131109 RepID=UPI00214CF7A1|nr:lipid II flippase MurJ [Actinomyces bowdenii]MCR2051916.1 MATE family efflux transporter [Actinomyces bowdenii]
MSGGTPPPTRAVGAAGPRGVLTAAGGVVGLTLVSRVLGFLRWIVQASTLGAGTVAGAYATANQVPNVLYEVVVGGALAATVVPLLAGPVAAGRREEAARTASALLGLVLAVLLPLCLALAVLAEPIAGLFPASQGVDTAVQVALVADFLRMFALQVPLYGVGVVLTGVLQAHGSFTWPALAPILSSLTVMATYGAYGAMAPAADGPPSAAALHLLGWGTTAGVAALSLPLLWPVHRLGLRLRPALRLGGAQAGRALRLAGAGIWTLLAQQASVLAALALARSGGTTGTIAVYQYTQAVYVLPYAVLAVPVATVLYPRLTAAFSAERQPAASGRGAAVDAAARSSPSPAALPEAPQAPVPGAGELAARSTGAVVAVAVAGAGMLLAASHGAERFFALLTGQVAGMGAALAVLAPALVGYVLIYQVTRVLFAADRSRDAALATGAGWVIVAGASWAAVGLLSQGGDGAATLLGLAVGQSTGMTCAGAGLLVALARLLGARALAPVGRALLLGAPVALACGLAVRVLSAAVDSPAAAIALACLGALATAAVVLSLLHARDRALLGVLRQPRQVRA